MRLIVRHMRCVVCCVVCCVLCCVLQCTLYLARGNFYQFGSSTFTCIGEPSKSARTETDRVIPYAKHDKVCVTSHRSIALVVRVQNLRVRS